MFPTKTINQTLEIVMQEILVNIALTSLLLCVVLAIFDDCVTDRKYREIVAILGGSSVITLIVSTLLWVIIALWS